MSSPCSPCSTTSDFPSARRSCSRMSSDEPSQASDSATSGHSACPARRRSFAPPDFLSSYLQRRAERERAGRESAEGFFGEGKNGDDGRRGCECEGGRKCRGESTDA